MFRFYQARSKQYEPRRVQRYSLSKSSLSAKDKRSALMASENDLLQPNTGDIPLETINHIRKHTVHTFSVIVKYFVFDTEQERLKPIPQNEFHAHVTKMHENRDYGFEDEYQVRATHQYADDCVSSVMFVWFRALVQNL